MDRCCTGASQSGNEESEKRVAGKFSDQNAGQGSGYHNPFNAKIQYS